MNNIIMIGAVIGSTLMLTACGGGKNDAKAWDSKANNVVITSGAFNAPEEADYVIKEVIEPFEKESGIDIDFQVAKETDSYKKAKLQKETGDVTVDLMILHTGDMPKWLGEGYIADSTEAIKGYEGRTFMKAFDTETKKGGKTYFAPISADVYLTIANAEAEKYLPEGVNVDDLSWEDYANWSNAIAKGEGVGKTVTTGIPMKTFLYQFGAAQLSNGAEFPNLNSEETKQTWKLYEKMANDFIPSVKNVDDTVGPLRRGEAWLTVAHNAKVGQIYATNETGYVIGPAPKGPKGRGTIAGAYGIGVMEGSKNQEAAKIVMEYLTRPETLVKISKGTGGFIPPVEEAVGLLGDDPEDQVIKKAMTVLEEGAVSGTNASQFKDWGAVKQVYDNVFGKLLNNKKVTDKDLDEAQKELEALKK